MPQGPCPPPTPLQATPGPGTQMPKGCGRAGWALRNGRALVPRGLPGAKGSQHRQAGTCLRREKHELGRAGQRRLDFPSRCAAQKPGREGLWACQVCADSLEGAYTLRLPRCPLLVARWRGEVNPALGTCLAWFQGQGEEPAPASAPPSLQLCQSFSGRLHRGSPPEGSHCTVNTEPAC